VIIHKKDNTENIKGSSEDRKENQNRKERREDKRDLGITGKK
jgi:hypothetical protein